ncbi:hypothetical protein RIEPE_0279 [Candidatus Riesia pediculicola USDA]|uniref:Uncharacterized protein n=1 Tax=Riesia pediculicola (strain USDA) TaxID=515618 RepID=D4G874_RIEPU|nr:hypothetical protein RIEPE_0279 [Candidatus Riesia pediculicola USDA]
MSLELVSFMNLNCKKMKFIVFNQFLMNSYENLQIFLK